MKDSKKETRNLTSFIKDALTVAQTKQVVGKGQTELNPSETEPASAEIHNDWVWE